MSVRLSGQSDRRRSPSEPVPRSASGSGRKYDMWMGLCFETRESDSAWVHSVWTCTSAQVEQMTSVATTHWGLVFWEHEGSMHAGVSGPETTTSIAPVPQDATFVGIEFALGTSLRALPTPALVNGGVGLPDTMRRSFRLDGSRWETPGPDDAEALVGRLVRDGAVVRDPITLQVVQGHRPAVSRRTVERRFQAATGLTQGVVRQIERARRASALLAGGVEVSDVVTRLGYFDESHLARALRRFVGRTVRQLVEGTGGAIALDLDQPLIS